jgi:hypothetical protein
MTMPTRLISPPPENSAPALEIGVWGPGAKRENKFPNGAMSVTRPVASEYTPKPRQPRVLTNCAPMSRQATPSGMKTSENATVWSMA